MSRVEHLAEGITLYLGDCLEILPTLPKVDAVVTSPPYPGANMWHSDSETLTKLNLSVLTECSKAVRENGVICWQIADIPAGDHGVITTTTTTTTTHAVCHLGLKLRAQIVWDKGTPHLPPPCFMRRPVVPSLTHEWVLVFFKGGWIPRELRSGVWEKGAMTSSVWRIAPERDRTHIAPYPVALASRMVDYWSLSGEVVCDPFMGSGTTGVASVKRGRKFIGIEIEPKYFDIACKRIYAALKQPDMFIEKPKPAKQEAML